MFNNDAYTMAKKSYVGATYRHRAATPASQAAYMNTRSCRSILATMAAPMTTIHLPSSNPIIWIDRRVRWTDFAS
ncbi:hypothetical protein BN1708_008606 [Verticillium longisporum]|uniref:Uncharacterized protein n=1 Tax=Verticillium longisporum TaxID=100787 RepID=A0A0G4N5P7_VERLO|nr:hypothetical protein BN1708_008606 [Verticillium longisporum]